MPHQIPWTISVRDHPGSTLREILNEPHWGGRHQHRVGYKNRQDRRAGLTHEDDERTEEAEEALQRWHQLEATAKKGGLINFRNMMENQENLNLVDSRNRSKGWRFVLQTTENYIKAEEDWPANVHRREKQEEEEREEKKEKETQAEGGQEEDDDGKRGEPTQEHEWKRSQGNHKHHDAYGSGDTEIQGNDDEEQKGEYEKLLEKYSVQEIALLRAIQHEKNYIKHLGTNDGKGRSPQTHNRSTIAIDEADQFTPDNWLPRSDDLIRLTGKHPLNAEAHLSHLFDAGLITPNELHYTRNHGAVPRCVWELHKLNIATLDGHETSISMDRLKEDFDWINIPVALACDGNRRKELNMVRKSKGFNWGSGAVSCAYWKGPLLRDVLIDCGVPDVSPTTVGKKLWVNFEGADEPSEGKYSTCIPFEYVMSPTNDVILAYEMNDMPLPPDHGYPVRVMIPGYVGGRCVKWVNRIWISDSENDSYYHIWDNRVLPSFVTEKDGEFAEALFRHPDTACNEQNLNSVIVHPAQGEKLSIERARKGKTYRIAGYAYDGGGHEVQRVEVSLDGGETWLYCIRKFPNAPVRHGNKFWTWLHWHVDVSITHLLASRDITVRCWNVFKNTQPEKPDWNSMGMMNNCWYKVKGEIVMEGDGNVPSILWRHPTEPGTGDGGWMRPSRENQIAAVKQAAGAPQKKFTREEIEKHDQEDDCWLVVDGQVYDATSVLNWHPGGKSSILGHAGRVHLATSDEFASIHDGFAYQKLKECALGVVTDKAAKFIKEQAKAAARDKANSKSSDETVTLQKHKWVPVALVDRHDLSDDTRAYTFRLPEDTPSLGLGTCQHVQLGFHMKDKMLVRSYTPTKPLLPAKKKDQQQQQQQQQQQHCSLSSSSSSCTSNDEDESLRDGHGTFELVVKTYFPTDEQPGGAMSNILDTLPIGGEVEIRGPTGEIQYTGNGRYVIEDEERTFHRVSLVLGGSGITPGYALIARLVHEFQRGHTTEVRVVDANKSQADILLRSELDGLIEKSGGRLKITHVLSHPSDDWNGLKGHVDEKIIRDALFEPAEDSVVFLCGPPAMIQKAAIPALKDWGYKEDENMFGF